MAGKLGIMRARPSLWRVGWKVIGALGLWLSSAPLLMAIGAMPGYVTHAWEMGSGLPQNTVNCVLQTQDGYLWIGTYNGLARFDGVRFVVFDNSNTPELRNNGIMSLFESRDGALWIGHAGGEVTLYRKGRFEGVETKVSVGAGDIRAIGQDESGEVWILHEPGLLERLRDGLVLTPQSGPVPGHLNMARSGGGTIWVDCNGRVSELAGGRLVVLDLAADSYVDGIGASRDGGLWLVSGGILRKWKGRGPAEDFGPVPSGSSPALELLETRDGWLAASTIDHGFFLFQPRAGAKAVQFSRNSGFPSDWVRSLCEDREGNLWVGTEWAGLQAVRPAKVQSFSPPDQWQGRAVLSVSSSSRDGGLWVGSEGAGLYHFKEGAWENFGAGAGTVNLYIWSAVEDPQGELWVASWGGGLYQLRNGRLEPAPGMEGITLPMAAVICSRQGGLWIGTQDGLLRYNNGRTSWFGRRGRPAERGVRTVLEESDGTVWFGTTGGGLGCLKDGAVRQFRKQDGLANDYVTCLRRDEDGALWIGTAGGLNRLKEGRLAAIREGQGLPGGHICDIEEDELGFFWLSSHNGIFRASKADLDRCAEEGTNEVHCLSYGLSDGMPTLECSGGLQPAGCKTADGRLWFPTIRGLVCIDPKSVRTNALPPPVVVESLTVDGRTMAGGPAAALPLRVSPGSHQFEFKYAGLSFCAPEKVQFKYQLAGLEPAWVQAGTRRGANYSYIPPGSYTFRVIACNNDGVWNGQGAELALTVLPLFWQTLWFRLVGGLGLALLAGGSVWFDMRRRMRRKIDHVERQHAVERERARIAKDIHDDLGASLTRITMLSQSARKDLDDPARAAADLGRIYDTAGELTRAMDEIVWAVNPRHDTLESLVSYLCKFAQDYVRAAGIRCSFDVPTCLPPWALSAELRHNLFLALKESLHNVVKHAAASEVRVALDLHPPGFTLTVEDNGCGFTPEPQAMRKETAGLERISSGNGLANMRQRLAQIGGRCEVLSTPGAGTRVTLGVALLMETHD